MSLQHEIGFGKLESYQKLEKLGEVSEQQLGLKPDRLSLGSIFFSGNLRNCLSG